MNFYADYIRNKLDAVIFNMCSQIEDFVKNPGHDFTRNRKMNFTSMHITPVLAFVRQVAVGAI